RAVVGSPSEHEIGTGARIVDERRYVEVVRLSLDGHDVGLAVSIHVTDVKAVPIAVTERELQWGGECAVAMAVERRHAAGSDHDQIDIAVAVQIQDTVVTVPSDVRQPDGRGKSAAPITDQNEGIAP